MVGTSRALADSSRLGTSNSELGTRNRSIFLPCPYTNTTARPAAANSRPWSGATRRSPVLPARVPGSNDACLCRPDPPVAVGQPTSRGSARQAAGEAAAAEAAAVTDRCPAPDRGGTEPARQRPGRAGTANRSGHELGRRLRHRGTRSRRGAADSPGGAGRGPLVRARRAPRGPTGSRRPRSGRHSPSRNVRRSWLAAQPGPASGQAHRRLAPHAAPPSHRRPTIRLRRNRSSVPQPQ